MLRAAIASLSCTRVSCRSSHASKRARSDRSRISTAVLVNELDQNDAQSAVERELFLSGRVGTKVKNAHHQYFTPVRQPNDCCPRKRHVWGTRQSRWFRGPAALLCELSLFVLAVTSRKTDPRSDACASDIKRPVVPHTAKRRKLRPRPARVSGPSFCLVR